MTTWTTRTKPTTTWSKRNSDTLWSQENQPWLATSYPWQTTGIETSWLQTDSWNYFFTGLSTLEGAGWVAAPGATLSTRFSETSTLGVYRATCSGVTTDERLDRIAPWSGSLDFTTGVTIEWYAKYALSSAGTSQSNVYVGDNNQIIRVLYTNSNITVRRTSGAVIYTDSSTDITTYHKYKLVISGDTVDYYVDDVLLNSGTDGTTSGTATNYVRIFHRCSSSGATYDVSYQWLRVRNSTGSTVNTSWTTRTQP